MTQAQLNRAVARVTGESRRLISRLGFSLADPPLARFDPEPSDVAKYLDWDQVAQQRFSHLGVY
jgi:hypothetical protein